MSPNGDGNGVVIDRKTAKKLISKDVAARGVAAKPRDFESFMDARESYMETVSAIEAAGVNAVIVVGAGQFGADGNAFDAFYNAVPAGVEIRKAAPEFYGSLGGFARDTPSAALAIVQPLIDEFDAIVIDTTK